MRLASQLFRQAPRWERGRLIGVPSAYPRWGDRARNERRRREGTGRFNGLINSR